jgi:hypothetical protein
VGWRAGSRPGDADPLPGTVSLSTLYGVNAGDNPDVSNDANTGAEPVVANGRPGPGVETFRPPPGSRRAFRRLWFVLIVILLLCVLVAVRAPASQSGPWVYLSCVFGVLVVYGVFQMVNLRRAFTEVGPDGIRIRVGWRRYELAWKDVANITAPRVVNRTTSYSVIVTTTANQRIRLAVPRFATTDDAWMPGDTFREQYHRIMVHWKTATGAPVSAKADEFDNF